MKLLFRNCFTSTTIQAYRNYAEILRDFFGKLCGLRNIFVGGKGRILPLKNSKSAFKKSLNEYSSFKKVFLYVTVIRSGR